MPEPLYTIVTDTTVGELTWQPEKSLDIDTAEPKNLMWFQLLKVVTQSKQTSRENTYAHTQTPPTKRNTWDWDYDRIQREMINWSVDA